MKLKFDEKDFGKLLKLEEIMERNSEILRRFADYLIAHPCFITKELIDDIVQNCEVSEEYAFTVLFIAACGLDTENNQHDMQLAEDYFFPSIKRLEAAVYRENAYYKKIRVPEISHGDWELRYERYQPYEAFIYQDIRVDRTLREIPSLGFFSEEFLFPAVLEHGIEWMTITPNEIETMQPVIEEVEGRVITYGLGLGYFTFMVSEKEEVHQITVVEKNQEVISLFEQYILPQFSKKEKVRIVFADAFDYAAQSMEAEGYDYAFVDLWHDVSDGVELYLRMKKLEHLAPNTRYLYWIEESLLSNLRFKLFWELIDDEAGHGYLERELTTFEELSDYLSSSSLKKLVERRKL